MVNKFIQFKDKQGLRKRMAFSTESENQFKMADAVIREIERKFPKLEIKDDFIKDFLECSKDVLQTVAGNYKKYNFFLDFFSRI